MAAILIRSRARMAISIRSVTQTGKLLYHLFQPKKANDDHTRGNVVAKPCIKNDVPVEPVESLDN